MSEIVSSLPDDFVTLKRASPHRDTVLRQTLDRYVKCYGEGTPLDLDRLNSLLAANGHPLATKTEIDVFYGQNPPVAAVN